MIVLQKLHRIFSTLPQDLHDLIEWSKLYGMYAYGFNARKCIKSSLFSIGVVFGLPKFFLDPILVLISNNDGPLDDLSFSMAFVTSSSVAAINVWRDKNIRLYVNEKIYSKHSY